MSVIIPCFNQAKFLSEAVRSLQRQKYEYWECVIINDGSTDETKKVAAILAIEDSRVRLISQSNRGLSGARNRGVSETSGLYLQFLDADDLLESRKLDHQVDFLDRHPEVGIVYSDARYFTTEDPHFRGFTLIGDDVLRKETEPWIGPLWSSGRALTALLFERNIMAVNCALVRRAVFGQVGFWDERMNALEDWEFWARCAYRGIRFQHFPILDGLALVRSHRTSMSRDQGRMKRAAIHLRNRLARGLGDTESKLRNFEVGLSLLSNLSRWERIRLSLSLAWANRTKRVFRQFVAFHLRRHPRMRRFAKRFAGLLDASWTAEHSRNISKR